MERYKTIIPLETWDRKFIFETFSQREFPYEMCIRDSIYAKSVNNQFNWY